MPATSPPLSLSLNPSSSADTGDNLFENGFNVTFGDKVTGSGASSGGGGSTILTGLIREAGMALFVALSAKFLWSKIK